MPEEAGIGDTPARLANAPSERNRPRCDQEQSTVAATTDPTPHCSRSSGRQARTIVGELPLVSAGLGLELEHPAGERAEHPNGCPGSMSA